MKIYALRTRVIKKVCLWKYLLTILTGKTVFCSIHYKNGWLAASDLFGIKFFYTFHFHVLRVHEICDSLNTQ